MASRSLRRWFSKSVAERSLDRVSLCCPPSLDFVRAMVEHCQQLTSPVMRFVRPTVEENCPTVFSGRACRFGSSGVWWRMRSQLAIICQTVASPVSRPSQ
jgi:hypothetical protein